MQATDKAAFAAVMVKTWGFYGKTPERDSVIAWFELLESFPMDAVAAAFQRHLVDPKAGQYLPKPADVVRHLQPRAEDDGHPGPDEAWGLLVRLIQDEAETGVLTDEMRAGWQACDPILKLGDEVGARRCFLEAYSRHVEDARRHGQRARWTVTLGTCPQLRAQRLNEAVKARRLTADQARSLLPGPTPISLDQVAGLLEGPDASPDEHRTAERLRSLAQMLRASYADEEARRAEQRQRERDAEEARRQQLLDQASARRNVA